MVPRRKDSSSGMSRTWEESCNVEAIVKKPAALSQVQYLEQKLKELEEQITQAEEEQKASGNVIKELYFKKGKLYSELELMKRVPHY